MNKRRRNLIIARRLCSIWLLTCSIAAFAQAQTQSVAARNQPDETRGRVKPGFQLSIAHFSFPLMRSTSTRTNATPNPSASLIPMSAVPNLPVLGGGTIGRFAKWTGLTSGNSFIGDTNIFEDKLGNVGIGTDSPTSKLTIAGSIQASGGSSVLHRATLMRDGTAASLLGVAVPLSLTGSGETILTVRNSSARGDGMFAFGGDSSNSFGGNGVSGFGGVSVSGTGGAGLSGIGGGADSGAGGIGIGASGGNSNTANGGDGVNALGGIASAAGSRGGTGIVARGGAGLNGATNGLAGDFSGRREGLRGCHVGRERPVIRCRW